MGASVTTSRIAIGLLACTTNRLQWKQAFVYGNIIYKVNLTKRLVYEDDQILYSADSTDPSIIRVGDDYYIAVSSFEWFPEYQSIIPDLMHWQLIGHALKTKEYLDLTGEEPSKCGFGS